MKLRLKNLVKNIIHIVLKIFLVIVFFLSKFQKFLLTFVILIHIVKNWCCIVQYPAIIKTLVSLNLYKKDRKVYVCLKYFLFLIFYVYKDMQMITYFYLDHRFVSKCLSTKKDSNLIIWFYVIDFPQIKFFM